MSCTLIRYIFCSYSVPQTTTVSTTDDKDVCTKLPYTGPCRAQKIRWFYNYEKDMCDQFTYGGCDSNGNNFISKEDCVKKCKNNNPKTDVESHIDDASGFIFDDGMHSVDLSSTRYNWLNNFGKSWLWRLIFENSYIHDYEGSLAVALFHNFHSFVNINSFALWFIADEDVIYQYAIN